MKQRRGLLQKVTEGVGLPGEPLPGLPVVEIAGDRRVLVENHKGVTEYGTDRISVRVSYGEVRICGSELSLARMTGGLLLITGIIDGVTVFRRNCK